jgi:hypothetical protein
MERHKGELRLFKLVDGSIVIGNQAFSTITDTLQLHLVDDELGTGVSITPLLFPFNEEKRGCTIGTGTVITSMPCPPDLADAYFQELTGIIPATQLLRG